MTRSARRCRNIFEEYLRITSLSGATDSFRPMHVALPHSDERELAFRALLPLAQTISEGLTRVDAVLEDERKSISPFRKKWHRSQHASARGYSRFSHTVLALRALEESGALRLISTDSQEAQNIWLWRIDERHVLRIKHDLDDVVDPGTATLFSLEPSTGDVTVFLTWETRPDGSIRSIAFASRDEPKWAVLLRELLEAANDPTPHVEPARPRLNVRSKLVDDNAGEQSSDG